MSYFRPDHRKLVLVSGGFDPIHVGHVRMIESAGIHGGVVVVLNSDEWLMRKKGYVFMPWAERAEIILNLKNVLSVEPVDDSDETICEALTRIRPDIFANGGDRKLENTPEIELCEKLNIELLWNAGGGKIQSSSDLVDRQKEQTDKNKHDVRLKNLLEIEEAKSDGV